LPRFQPFIYQHPFPDCLLLCAEKLPEYCYYNWNLISADKEDNKFSDCAIAAAADYIITEDSHFNILKQIDFPKMNIIGADDFMKMIG